MYVSLDFPELQGSMRYLDNNTFTLTPRTGAQSWSTEELKRAQAPLDKFVLQVLLKKKTKSNSQKLYVKNLLQ